jgi:hypothetical protein
VSSRKLILSFIAVFVLLGSSLIVSVDADSLMWIQTYGGEGTEDSRGVVETSDGGYAIAGTTSSFGVGEPNEWGKMPNNIWLVKIDGFGNVEWNRTYGGLGGEATSSLVVTSDGGYAVTGWQFLGTTDEFGNSHSIQAGLLIKTDELGNTEWSKTFDCYADSVVETSDGGYAITGFKVNWDTDETDFWLVKMDEAGSILWTQTYGGEHSDKAWSMIETSDGGYALTGFTGPSLDYDFLLVKTDQYGNMEWNRTYGGPYDDIARSLVETSDGGYAIAGETSSFGAGEVNVFGGGKNENFWFVKTDEFGNVEWNQTYGGLGYDWTMSLIKTSDGGYAIAGQTDSSGAGSIDFWFVKTDEFGNVEWNQTYGGQDHDWPASLVETSDGGYAIVGCTYSFGVGSGDILLIKTNEYGIVPEPHSFLIVSSLFTATLVIIIYKKKLFYPRS